MANEEQGNSKTPQVVLQFCNALDELRRAVNEEDESAWKQAMDVANRELGSNPD